jgi:hypothetical protein
MDYKKPRSPKHRCVPRLDGRVFPQIRRLGMGDNRRRYWSRPRYFPGGKDTRYKANGLRRRGGSHRRSLEVVWIITIPTLNNSLRFDQRNCTSRTYCGWARTTESKKDSGHGCPPPPAVPDRRDHMGKRPRRDTRQRKGRCPSRKGSREGCLVAHYIPSLHKATDIREVPEKQEEMGRGPSPPWQRRNPTPSGKEVLHGPSQKLHRTDGCTNKDRPLAVRCIFQ